MWGDGGSGEAWRDSEKPSQGGRHGQHCLPPFCLACLPVEGGRLTESWIRQAGRGDRHVHVYFLLSFTAFCTSSLRLSFHTALVTAPHFLLPSLLCLRRHTHPCLWLEDFWRISWKRKKRRAWGWRGGGSELIPAQLRENKKAEGLRQAG